MKTIGVWERILISDLVVEGEAVELDSLVQRHLTAGAAVAIGRKPAEDLEQPRANGLSTAQRIETLEGLEVGFLDQVFCCRGVPRQSEGQSVEGVQMRQRDLLETVPVRFR